MSLFGAMFTGVTGLNAQSKKIGSISDNIANVNTVGYKKADTQFESLVITTGSSKTYTPGGVLPSTRYLIDQQGLLVNSSSVTDLAVSGQGFFVVKEGNDGIPLYTRAGSFRPNEDGDLQNVAGYKLQGWPLDINGKLPGEPGNPNTVASSTFESLETVNINKASGQARPTTTVAISANLNAGEKILPGESYSAAMDAFSNTNFGIGADDIIASSEYNLSTLNNVTRGDQIEIATGNGQVNDFTYGGYTVGRNVGVAGAGNIGDGATVLAPTTLAAGTVQFNNLSSTVNVTLPGVHNLQSGAVVNLAGFAATAGIPASELNGAHTVIVTGPNTFSFTTTTAATSTTNNAGGETANTRPYTGNIMDALTPSQAFLSTTPVSNYSANALTFTVTTNTTGTKTFTYVSGSPSAAAGQFSSLSTLAQAISNVSGLNARVVGGRLVVSSEDANEAVTFANGDVDGDIGPPIKQGIDWTGELGLSNISSGSSRFNTLRGLYKLVTDAPGISATLESELSKTKLGINVDSPLDTLRIKDYVQTPPTALGTNPITVTGVGPSYTITVTDPTTTATVGGKVVLAGIQAFNGFSASELNGTFQVASVVPGASYSFTVTPAGAVTAGTGGGATGTAAVTNNGSLIAELGFVPSLNGVGYTPQDTGIAGPKYDASGITGENMASGKITPQFSHQMRIYDSLGSGHDVRVSFIKADDNNWAVEVYAIPKSDVSSTLPDGQLATGFINFNGDGSLRSISPALANAINMNWSNGSSPSTVSIDWGTAGPPSGTLNVTDFGKTDGMRQFDQDYDVNFVNQDGAQAGYLVGIAIDPDGKVIASFSNGKSQAIYQVPLADFPSANGLRPVTGNVFAATQESGDATLRKGNTGGMGTVQSGTLESSNVDLATELTDMIVAQRAYQSNTRVIQTADSLLQELQQIGR